MKRSVHQALAVEVAHGIGHDGVAVAINEVGVTVDRAGVAMAVQALHRCA